MSGRADDRLGCLECGLIQRLPELAPRQKAICRQCGMTVLRHCPNQMRTGMALILSAIILSAPSLLEPLFVANVFGHQRFSAVFTGVTSLWTDAWWPLALVVLGFVIVIPMVWLCALLFVFLCLEYQARPPSLPYVYRAAETLNAWAMPDVFLVGAAVAYARMNSLASVAITDGGWCFFAFAFLVMAIRSTIDSAEIWNAIGSPPAVEGNVSLICPGCALALPSSSSGKRCPRCKSMVSARRSLALDSAVACLIAAYLLYIPANLLPVLRIAHLNSNFSTTILGGVWDLAKAGMWPLAVVVFAASIIIPTVKLIGLTWCLTGTRQAGTSHLIERARLYRVIDRIGRWSNIDVFVISILTALIQFGAIGTAQAGAGAVAFGAVVVLTMLASRLFDSRLMWPETVSIHER